MTMTPKQVGERIRRARLRAKLTQVALGKRCGMAAARISDAENGKGELLVGTLERIAQGLGKNLDYFFRVDSRRKA